MSNSWNTNPCNKKGKSEGEPFRGSSDRTYPCIWTFRLYKAIDLYKNLVIPVKVLRSGGQLEILGCEGVVPMGQNTHVLILFCYQAVVHTGQ
jgi:hypothetical protein